MAERFKEWFQSRRRFVLYATLLLLLAGAAVVSIRLAQVAGAYLTQEGNWQELAGDYRVGIIDYTVDINEEPLIVQGQELDRVDTYQMVIPQIASVRLFDPTLSDDLLRGKEFQEGATMVRFRVVNRSESLVSVSAILRLAEEHAGPLPYLLPLPTELEETDTESLDYRRFVLDTLGLDAAALQPQGEAAALQAFQTAYEKLPQELSYELGVIPGQSLSPPEDSRYIQENGFFYSYRDFYILAWSEYGTGEYDSDVVGSETASRWARIQATFTVGQLE